MLCSKCKGEMEEGIIVTKNNNVNKVDNVTIVWGTKLQSGLMFMKLENEKQMTVLRCNKCGFIEYYAK